MFESTARGSGRRWLGIFLGVAAAGLLMHLVLTTTAWAQPEAPPAGAGEMGVGTFRTVKQMRAFDAAHPNFPVVMPPSLPTVDFGQYRAAKATTKRKTKRDKQKYHSTGSAPLSAAPSAPLSAAALVQGTLGCEGFGQLAPLVGGDFPPDPHGAIGANHFGQVVKTAIRFYTKALTGNCPSAIVLNTSLSAFIGYTTKALFNPRLVYDLTYDRWILSVEAQPESSTVQYHFIMVSKDSDPTHGFYKHQFNIADIVGAGMFWDFPQLGYDEEALILTGNQFNATPSYIGSTVIFFPKHRLYANLPFDFCFFQGAPWNVGTIAPPIVLDQGPYTTLAAAVPASSFIRVYKFVGTSRACPTSLGSSDIATPINVPPLAEQPGSGPCPAPNCLDTGDGRFQNAGTQVGEPGVPGGSPVRFWQIRTDSDSGFPTPLTYKINADALTIEDSCEFFASTSSFDFNPSIVAN
jgi:hypothetical protein